MSTVTVSSNKSVRQMSEMSQRKKQLKQFDVIRKHGSRVWWFKIFCTFNINSSTYAAILAL